MLMLLAAMSLVGCSKTSTKSPDVSASRIQFLLKEFAQLGLQKLV
jgi:hypothetical protein